MREGLTPNRGEGVGEGASLNRTDAGWWRLPEERRYAPAEGMTRHPRME